MQFVLFWQIKADLLLSRDRYHKSVWAGRTRRWHHVPQSNRPLLCTRARHVIFDTLLATLHYDEVPRLEKRGPRRMRNKGITGQGVLSFSSFYYRALSPVLNFRRLSSSPQLTGPSTASCTESLSRLSFTSCGRTLPKPTQHLGLCESWTDALRVHPIWEAVHLRTYIWGSL